ncbi:MAG: hypothetical protein SGJ19_07345 [Planctomycetia bacterium]|nr:hypothetical protein [Planctomycetia bacterium]
MSSQFVFSVDTDEVATTVAPPTPVIAAPRRRTMAPPTVALRLPDVRDAAPLEVRTATSLQFQPVATLPMVEEQTPTPLPAMTLPRLPKLASADPTSALDDLARASVAQLVPATVVAVSAPQPEVIAPTAVVDQEVLWKNPKVMLAGVAAAFLGMVSLMAMNHGDNPVADEAPKWNGPSVAMPTRSNETESTPLVSRAEQDIAPQTRGGYYVEMSEALPAERTAQAPARDRTWSQPAATAASHQGPWIDQATGRERISFDDIDENEGTAHLVPPLPNLAQPTEREANQQAAQPDGSYR